MIDTLVLPDFVHLLFSLVLTVIANSKGPAYIAYIIVSLRPTCRLLNVLQRNHWA